VLLTSQSDDRIIKLQVKLLLQKSLFFASSTCSPLGHPEQDDAQLPLVTKALTLDTGFWFGLA